MELWNIWMKSYNVLAPPAKLDTRCMVLTQWVMFLAGLYSTALRLFTIFKKSVESVKYIWEDKKKTGYL